MVNPQRHYQQAAQRLDDLSWRLHRAAIAKPIAYQSQLWDLTKRLHTQRPDRKLQALRGDLQRTQAQLKQAVQRSIDRRQQRAGEASRMLSNLSPLPTLSRGYAVLRNRDSTVLSDASGLNAGQHISVQLRDGRFTAEVLQVSVGATLNEALEPHPNHSDEKG